MAIAIPIIVEGTTLATEGLSVVEGLFGGSTAIAGGVGLVDEGL